MPEPRGINESFNYSEEDMLAGQADSERHYLHPADNPYAAPPAPRVPVQVARVIPQPLPAQVVVNPAPVSVSSDTFEIAANQKKVKCCSKCLTFWAYALLISGAINVVCNVFFIFVLDSFTTIQWYDREGKYQSINMDPGFLFLLALAKIIGGGYLLIRQGKGTLKILKPLLKEYKDAEHGLTNGIPMVERKSEALKEHKKDVKRITLGMIAILFLTVIVIKGQATDKVDAYIIAKYDQKNANSTEPFSFSMDLVRTLSNDKFSSANVDDIWNEAWTTPEMVYNQTYPTMPRGAYAYNSTTPMFNESNSTWHDHHANSTWRDHHMNGTNHTCPMHNQSNSTVHPTWHNMNMTASNITFPPPMPPIKVPEVDHHKDKHHDGDKKEDEHHHHHDDKTEDEKKSDKHHHHDDKKDKKAKKDKSMLKQMKKMMSPAFDLDDMTCKQACDFVNMIIGSVCAAMFVYATFWILLSQGLYIFVINKIKNSQERLETRFMGPANPVRSVQVAVSVVPVQAAPQVYAVQQVPQAPVTGHVQGAANGMN
jgi:hypothetical protein